MSSEVLRRQLYELKVEDLERRLKRMAKFRKRHKNIYRDIKNGLKESEYFLAKYCRSRMVLKDLR